MLDKLEIIYERYNYLEEQLSNPDIIGDMSKFTKTNRDYKELLPLVAAYHTYKNLLDNLRSAKEMVGDADLDMRDMAREEVKSLEPQVAAIEEEIKVLLIPKALEDSKDVIFEIRSGTGGDEASIFAGDLYRMYTRYFDTLGWKNETVFVNEGSAGGYSKVILEVSGDNVYGRLKFESGAHRVQRIPETESKGRVHTSAATVVVMPKMEMEEFNINPADLKIDVFRSSGAGGQHVNKTESAVRITHLPTGVVSECQEGRSQIQNREIAMQRLYQRIVDQKQAAFDSEISSQRRSLVGSGDRSDKIRTYNYPQNRVTDHRIDLTLYKLDRIMEGEVNDVIEALRMAENAQRLQDGGE
jgi:peptide chain release factor 1